MITAARVEGARRLRSTLRQAGVHLSQMREVHLRVGRIVATAARTLVPIGPPENGHLRDTIRPGATQTAAFVRAGTARKPYGGPVHWGWPARHIQPQTFLVDAAKQTEKTWMKEYFTGVKAIISKIEGA